MKIKTADSRISRTEATLRTHPSLGRVGPEPRVRKLVIGNTPYIIPYRVQGHRVIISTIWHGAKRREL